METPLLLDRQELKEESRGVVRDEVINSARGGSSYHNPQYSTATMNDMRMEIFFTLDTKADHGPLS